ncbi:unnamed protein product [Schistosoma bovis]|nr:unnamed protein product [Schistosoma bovis]
MTNTIQNVSLCVDNIQIPSMISELSWMNQSDLCSGITTMKMTETAETATTTMTTTTTTSSSSTSSTSCSDYHFDGSHHLHMLFRYPHKYIGKIPKNIPKLKQNQESDLKYHQIQSNNDLRIKLERELSQKVRQAVKTPPRERIIRRRLNEFHYEINKRLKNEEKKKQLVIQMNDKLNFNVTTNTTNTNISSSNNMNNINVMDLRMHPESYYQHLNWSKKSNINMNSQSILWNKKSGLSKKEINNSTFVPVTENNHENSYYDNQISLDSNEVHKNEDTSDSNQSLLYYLNNNSIKSYLHDHHSFNKPLNNDSFINCISNNTTYSRYLIHKLHNYKNTILNLKQSLLPISSNHSSTSNHLEYNHEYDQLLNDTFTFDWNINGSNVDRDQSINNDHNHDRNDDDHDDDLDHTITNHIHKYYQMRSSYLTDEDIQLIHKYYEKLYKNKRILDRMNRKLVKNHLCTRQSIMEKFGRLTDGEKQLFYFSGTRAAYLMATIQFQYKLPDGTQYRLMNQSTNKPLDYVIINNSFIDQTINDSSSSSSKVNNFNNDNTQTTNYSFNTLPTLIDWNAVVRDRHGPFWPQNYGPICQTLSNLHIETNNSNDSNVNKPTISDYTEEMNQLKNKQPYFKEIRVIFDSECSPCLSGTSSTSISSPLDVKQLVEELTNDQQWTPPCLVFESRFESGNLRQVRRIGPFHYELLLKPDLYTKRHVQWYFFRVQNILPGFIYTFLIVNFTKPTSLYSQGLQPLLYSKMNYQQNGKKWIRVGTNIKYTRNTMNLSNHLLDTNSEYYQLEWEMEFPYANDICYLAYSYPYTYTNLKSDLNELLIKSNENETLNKTINCEVLCQTRAGNSCFLVTITDQTIPNKDKYAVVITGRVHPGETNSSWITYGLLKFLTSNQSIVLTLKKQYTFYIIPMLNPDGVIVGNYRCSLTGRDLNRNYRQPKKDVFPTVWTVKQLVKWCKKTYKDVIYCDMHGHSRRNNIFMYGCDPLYRHSKIFNNTKKSLHERILPYIISQQATSYFSFPNCRFTVHPSKESTSRVVFWREFEVINSFTLEATFNGSTLQNNSLMKFEVDDFMKMGELLGYSLYKFYEVLCNPLKLKETLKNLAQQTLTNLWMTKIPLTPENTISEEHKDNLSIFNKKSYDFIKSQLYTTNKQFFQSTINNDQFNHNNNYDSILNYSLNDPDQIDGDQSDHDQMNDSLEQLAKAIHVLEKSIELHNIELNENELCNTNDNDISCTSDSNSDSEPEMTITDQNSLNQYYNLRGDLILTNQIQTILLDQSKQLKQSNNTDHDITRSYKLKKRKKNKKKKLQTLHDRHLRHHHHHHPRHHHHHHQFSSIQKQSYKNISSNQSQNNDNSTIHSKQLSSNSTSLSPPLPPSSSSTSTSSLSPIEGKRTLSEQNHKERLSRRLYYLNKYTGQSNHGIPCFVEKRLFHRSCQRIRTVWENIDLTNAQTIHAQRKFVERFINNLETKISKIKSTDNVTNIDVLKYLKQIHLEAKHQLQLIQSQLIPIIDKNHPYKSTMIHETMTTITNNIGIPYPPPLPNFTTTGHHIKTHSAIITTTNNSTAKRNMSIVEGGRIERNNNDLIPRSRSCNLFLRNNNNNINNNGNSKNNKLLELPKIIEKI